MNIGSTIAMVCLLIISMLTAWAIDEIAVDQKKLINVTDRLVCLTAKNMTEKGVDPKEFCGKPL